MNVATWKLPEGISADSSKNIIERMQHYRFLINHYLIDGTRIIPDIPTIQHILDAYDQFNLPVVIASNSYTLYVDNIS
jgi:hypothetical protein